ncbi:MAG: response regulator [Pseudomonadota bacterium]|nr:response regulator [Pseudomonadota bacterium]
MRKVLVVDDEVTVADALAAVLGGAGYKALVAYDGASALEVIGREHVDLVLTDLVMYGMDGADLIRWLRASPATQHLPVILMSMLPEERAFVLCSDYSRFLRKPLQFDALFAAIEDLCDASDPATATLAAAKSPGFVH